MGHLPAGRTVTRADAAKLFESDSDESSQSDSNDSGHCHVAGQPGLDTYADESGESAGSASKRNQTASASTSGRGSSPLRSKRRVAKPTTKQLVKAARRELHKAAYGTQPALGTLLCGPDMERPGSSGSQGSDEDLHAATRRALQHVQQGHASSVSSPSTSGASSTSSSRLPSNDGSPPQTLCLTCRRPSPTHTTSKPQLSHALPQGGVAGATCCPVCANAISATNEMEAAWQHNARKLHGASLTAAASLTLARRPESQQDIADSSETVALGKHRRRSKPAKALAPSEATAAVPKPHGHEAAEAAEHDRHAGVDADQHCGARSYLHHFSKGIHAAMPAAAGGVPGSWAELWRVQEGKAQCLLGDRHFFGHGCPCSWEEAFKCYTKSAEAGWPAGMCRLAACYQKGRGCLKDGATALHWFRMAAAHADMDALHAVGELYESGELAPVGMPQDLTKAAKYYRRAAEAGHLGAQASLGFLYEQGLGLPQDAEEALKWYMAAAERGHAKAQNNLGALLCCGALPLVAPDAEAAVEWYRKSSQQGNAAAMNNLGIAAEEGMGMPQDLDAALSLYQKAAEMGHAPAHANLAHLHVAGEDWVQAADHFRKAAEGGVADAWLHLGTIYEHGLGHARDLHAALRCFRHAAQQGLPEAFDWIEHAQDALNMTGGMEADAALPTEQVCTRDARLAAAQAEAEILRSHLQCRQAETPMDESGGQPVKQLLTIGPSSSSSGSSSAAVLPNAAATEAATPLEATLLVSQLHEQGLPKADSSSGSLSGVMHDPSMLIMPSTRSSGKAGGLSGPTSTGASTAQSLRGTLVHRSPLLGRRNASMPSEQLSYMAAGMHLGPALLEQGHATLPPSAAIGTPGTVTEPQQATIRSKAPAELTGSISMSGVARKAESIRAALAAADENAAVVHPDSTPNLQGRSNGGWPGSGIPAVSSSLMRPLGTAMGEASRNVSLKGSSSPFMSRSSSLLNFPRREVSEPDLSFGMPSLSRRMNPEASQRLQRKLQQKRERRKSTLPIFGFTSRAVSESRSHSADPAPLPTSKSLGAIANTSSIGPVRMGRRCFEKMAIMDRIQQMTNRHMLKLREDHTLLEKRAKDAEATAATLGQVMQALYLRLMAAEEQLRTAGLEPAQLPGTTLTSVGGFHVEALGLAKALPTAQLHNVFQLMPYEDDSNYLQADAHLDDGFNTVSPEFFTGGQTLRQTLRHTGSGGTQPDGLNNLDAPGSRRTTGQDVGQARSASLMDQSLRKQTLNNAMRLSNDITQGQARPPVGTQTGMAEPFTSGTPAASNPAAPNGLAGTPQQQNATPSARPRSILSQKSASDLSIKERRGSRLTLVLPETATSAMSQRSMVRASSTLT